MTSYTQSHPPYGFAIGLATGTLVGVGLAIWLSPRSASPLRERLTRSVRRIGQRTSDEYEQASSRVGEAFEAFTQPRAL